MVVKGGLYSHPLRSTALACPHAPTWGFFAVPVDAGVMGLSLLGDVFMQSQCRSCKD